MPCDKWDHGSKESEDIVEVVSAGLDTPKAGSWLFLRLGLSWFYSDILFVAVYLISKKFRIPTGCREFGSIFLFNQSSTITFQYIYC